MVEIKTKNYLLFISNKLAGSPYEKQHHYYYRDAEGCSYEIDEEEFIRLGGIKK